MNKLDLDKTMKYFGYPKEYSYNINNYTISYSNTGYTIIKGHTTYALASQLYQKYDNIKYKIRVNDIMKQPYQPKI